MFWGLLFIAIGVGWVLQYYGFIPADLDFFWPVLFIAIGVSILFSKDKKWGCDWFKDKK